MKIVRGFEKHSLVECVVSFGNFDGIHLGHDHIISTVKRIAAEQAMASAVITFDPHPMSFLFNAQDFLLLDFSQKVQLISNYQIDCLYIIEFDEALAKTSASDFIEKLSMCSVKHVVSGTSCTFGYNREGNMEMLKNNGIGLQVTELQPIIVDGQVCSSSAIRDSLRNGHLDLTNKMLNRPYQINGHVMNGLKRGKDIGFPTINVNIDDIIKPKFGVYYARVMVENNGEWYFGLVNIGMRPTFHDLNSPLLEMHIFDFSSMIYGRTVKIELLQFIRAEQKFSDVAQLKQQIFQDIEYAMRLKV